MRSLWLILALACSAALANGAARANGTALTGKAAPATTPVPAVRPLYFEHLTMRDGLSQSTVMSILQDRKDICGSAPRAASTAMTATPYASIAASVATVPGWRATTSGP